MNYVLSTLQHIDVTSNEIITTHSVNRNFEKLLENDKLLNSLRDSIYHGKLQPWNEYQSYTKGDIVWFREGTGLYILKSLKNANTSIPCSKIKNNRHYFNDSGWKDMNEFSTMFQDDLSVMIGRYFNSMIIEDHENNANYHRYTEMRLSSIDDYVLLKDMSNIKQDRDCVHYPYETHFLCADNCIRQGTYRRWDCGILEYDIIFRLGYTGNTITYNKLTYDEVVCNNLELKDERYYNSDDDKFILSSDEDDDNKIVFMNHIEKNHNDFVNVYTSVMKFEIPFVNTNYMIFGSDIRIQERNTDLMTIDKGMNTLVYTNKQTDQVNPVYIIYPENGTRNPRKYGLITNTFHCHIIGRWR